MKPSRLVAFFAALFLAAPVWAQSTGGASAPSSAQIVAGLGYTPLNPINGSVTGAMMASGAAGTNLGYTPINPANNGSDFASPATTFSTLGGGAVGKTSAGTGLGIATGTLNSIGAQRILCSIRTANFNTTTDQACPISSSITVWAPTAIWTTNCTTSLTLAAGGVYPTTSKGGTPLVAAVQVYSALSTAAIILPLTLAANIATTRYTVANVYLSLTTGQGTAATCDVYVLGVDLT